MPLAAAEIEWRSSELTRARVHQDSTSPGREKPETLIAGQNIAHFRQLLAVGGLDNDRRRSIEKLSAEEEAKLASKPSG